VRINADQVTATFDPQIKDHGATQPARVRLSPQRFCDAAQAPHRRGNITITRNGNTLTATRSTTNRWPAG